jgi:SulP family sulfate permease
MAPTATRHDSNRELFGQGLGNIVSPIMGGIPATAAIARTAAGIRNGASTRLTGVFHSLTVLTVTLVAGGLAVHVPLAALSAVLIVVAWNIAEVPELRRLARRAPRSDVMVLFATAGITLFFDLSYAIAFGIVASAGLLVARLVQLPAAEELLPDETGRIKQVSPELSELIQTRKDISFFTAQGMLSFHSAAAFEYELNGDARNPLILRMKDVHHIDTSGLLTLKGIIEHRQAHGGRMILTAVQPDLYPVLERFGIIDRLGPENVFERTRCAIASIDAPDGRIAHPRATSGRDALDPAAR